MRAIPKFDSRSFKIRGRSFEIYRMKEEKEKKKQETGLSRFVKGGGTVFKGRSNQAKLNSLVFVDGA